MAVLCSLSKAILLQAEVEVTAEKRSAVPLAQVASFFVQNLDRFPQIFYMKLVQRTGGWPIPVKPPPEEGIEYSKLAGFREDEGLPEYISRVAGLMRVYFRILITPTNQPTNTFFRPTMYWTYFARLMCDRSLLESGPVGPELLASECSLSHRPSPSLTSPCVSSRTRRRRCPSQRNLWKTVAQADGAVVQRVDGSEP